MTTKDKKKKALLWTTHRGDFCVRLPSFSSLSTLQNQLFDLETLFPLEMKRSFYSTPSLASQALKLKTSSPMQWKLLPNKGEAIRRDEEKEVLIFCAEQTPEYEELCLLLEGGAPLSHLNIDLSAIQSNIQTIRSFLPSNTSLMAMVKAGAYGTDEIVLSHLLVQSGIEYLGVAHPEEALKLRQAHIDQPIFVIHASEHEMDKIALAQAEVGVYTREQIHQANEAASRLDTTLLLHLHVDTGMKRFGAHYSEILSLAELIRSLPNIELQGLFSHFPASDDPLHDTFSKEQIARFSNVLSQLQQNGFSLRAVHMANSAAIFRFALPEATLARIGIALYGFSPSATLPFSALSPALTLETTISGLVQAKKGETISYGRRFQAPFDMTLAMLPIGYYDGLHRHHSGKQTVRIHQQEASLVGSICMDYMIADVTHIPSATTGTKVYLFGNDEKDNYICPASFSEKGDTILHELITCLGPRIRRLYIFSLA